MQGGFMGDRRILVVDDEPDICEMLERIIVSHGEFKVLTATNGFDALDILENLYIDLVLTDVKMPEMDGVELLYEIKKRYPETIVVLFTGYGTIKTAVAAMKQGAYDYITKPFEEAEITSLIDRIFESTKLREDNVRLLQEIQGLIGNNIIGNSKAMEEVFDFIGKVAPTESTVLITGASGTGKELVARAVHYLSNRSSKKFLAVNCSAIAENLLESELFGHKKGSFTGAINDRRGLFEEVNGGTIFLDEIAETSLAIQAKLLRVLESGEFFRIGDNTPMTSDFRLITATNNDLQERIDNNKFREDLYYRLNVLSIHLPLLRERKEDIPLLANHFVKKYRDTFGTNVKGISPEAMRTLVNYEYPGNVRELENVIERAIIYSKGEFIEPADILIDVSNDRSGSLFNVKSICEYSYKEARRAAIQEFNKEYLSRSLLASGGNVTKAAEEVGIERQYFQILMRKVGLKSADFRR
jgi:DNA-binding NtrC family response regulator